MKNKRYIPLIILTIAAVLFGGGCSTTNISELTKALSNDPAIVVLNVGSVYGTVKFTRIGAITNGMTISPDGTVSIRLP